MRVRLMILLCVLAVLCAAAVWSTDVPASISDRSLQENLQNVDLQQLLEKLHGVPITTWNYKTQDESIRHMGPMAQDFHAAFGLGEDDTHIATVDADGVALAGVQALYERVKALESENARLKQQLGATDDRLTELTIVVQTLTTKQPGMGSDEQTANK
ncbi:MAG: tail fiber domain-containing protein [bacterium]